MSAELIKFLNDLQHDFAEMSKPIRRVAYVGIVAVVYLLADTAIIQPISQAYEQVTDNISRVNAENAQLDKQIQSVENKLAADQSDALQKTSKALDAKINQLNQELEQTASKFVSAEEMRSFISQVLKNTPGVHMLTVEKLPVGLVLATPGKLSQQATSSTKVFQHGLRLKVKGRYQDILAYLIKLEKLPWQISWEAVSVSNIPGPEVIATLEIFTFSQEESWLTL